MTSYEMIKEFLDWITITNPSLGIQEKPTTTEILQFLNTAMYRYVSQVYNTIDTVKGNKLELMTQGLSDVLQCLITNDTLTEDTNTTDDEIAFIANAHMYNLPNNYMYYIKSISHVLKTYKNAEQLLAPVAVSNTLIENKDLLNNVNTAYNKPILRLPLVYIRDNRLLQVHDSYTVVSDPAQINITYYRRPNLITYSNSDNDVNCELPEFTHKDIVKAAVDIFITEAKYRLQTKLNLEVNNDKS